MRLSYLVTAGTGLVVFLMALSIKPTFLQPLVIHYVGSAASALCWPSLATLYWSRATGKGVTAGLVGGAGVYLLCVFIKPFAETFPMHPFVYGFIASALSTCIISLLTTPQNKTQQELYFGRE